MRFSFGDWSPSSNLTTRSTDPSVGGVSGHQCTEHSIDTCAFATRTAPLTIRMRFDCEPLAGSRFQGALASKAAPDPAAPQEQAADGPGAGDRIEDGGAIHQLYSPISGWASPWLHAIALTSWIEAVIRERQQKSQQPERLAFG